MIAFAGNSIFCRLALTDSQNDPISFTMTRLFAGAIALSWIFFKNRTEKIPTQNWKIFLGPAMLFSYALFFSLAYVKIGAGVGALILFTSVQITMMTIAFIRGNHLSIKEKIGFLFATTGFIYLVFPGLHRPSLFSAILMSLAGVSWGLYSILGQGAVNPFFSTARNFINTVPVLIVIFIFHPIQLTNQGMVFAFLSGGLTSGLGYLIWYLVLKQIKTSTAAIIQLSVPVIAALGGIIFLREELTQQLIVASLLIFGGIYLKITSKIE